VHVPLRAQPKAFQNLVLPICLNSISIEQCCVVHHVAHECMRSSEIPSRRWFFAAVSVGPTNRSEAWSTSTRLISSPASAS
jgi:hypothetical protein